MNIGDMMSLINRCEKLLNAFDKVGGLDSIVNRLELLQAMINELGGNEALLLKVEELNSQMYVFKKVMSVDETAEYLHVSRNTVKKLIDTKGLIASEPPSTPVVLLTEDVIQWCKKYRVEKRDAAPNIKQRKKKGSKK